MLECVSGDMNELGLRIDDAGDRKVWKGTIFGKTSKPCKHGK